MGYPTHRQLECLKRSLGEDILDVDDFSLTFEKASELIELLVFVSKYEFKIPERELKYTEIWEEEVELVRKNMYTNGNIGILDDEYISLIPCVLVDGSAVMKDVYRYEQEVRTKTGKVKCIKRGVYHNELDRRITSFEYLYLNNIHSVGELMGLYGRIYKDTIG